MSIRITNTDNTNIPANTPAISNTHAAIIQHGGADLLDALIDVEEHDEEHQRDAERDLRPDAKAKPQREDGRQNDARQRVGHLDVGIEYRGNPGLAREPETDGDPGNRADRESEN